MRTGGFPCRVLGCTLAFQVVDQKSMAALTAASSERTAHEVSVHDYHHVILRDERTYLSFQHSRPKPVAGK